MEQATKTPEKTTNIDRGEHYDWARNILVINNGNIESSDGPLADFLRIKSEYIEPLLTRGDFRSVVDVDRMDEIELELRQKAINGLVELSQALKYYNDIQAIVTYDDKDKVIDLIAIESDRDYKAVLIDRGGDTYGSVDFRALLAPEEYVREQ